MIAENTRADEEEDRAPDPLRRCRRPEGGAAGRRRGSTNDASVGTDASGTPTAPSWTAWAMSCIFGVPSVGGEHLARRRRRRPRARRAAITPTTTTMTRLPPPRVSSAGLGSRSSPVMHPPRRRCTTGAAGLRVGGLAPVVAESRNAAGSWTTVVRHGSYREARAVGAQHGFPHVGRRGKRSPCARGPSPNSGARP